MHQSIRGLIWDMDGVLVDSAPYHLRAWQHILMAEYRRMFTIEEFHRTFGMRNPDMLHLVLGNDLSAEEVSHLSDQKEALFRELVRADSIKLFPGVRTWLATAADLHLMQAVASSAPRANVETVVDVVDIRHRFSTLVASEDVSRGKPNPDVFLLAASAMGLAPAQCIVIEDAPVGIQAARSAGMTSIGVLNTHSSLAADLVLIDLISLSLEDALHQIAML